MPALALVGIVRWLPPVPIPLFLVWPFALFCLGVAKILEGDRPAEAAKLRGAVQVFRDLRGLTIDVDRTDRKPVRIRFL